MTAQDCMSEISNLMILEGHQLKQQKLLLTNDFQLWQFASQLIEQELVYMKASAEGYDKDEDVLTLISKRKR
ncbi:hypothetical protein OGZ02_00135 [Brachyspira hyodysenteriae]|nr:hypothetical protein [Brachyspira hyodysenteriae]MDA1467285.1 hypothetical protein [Brachyspira hyodysenteriae]